MLVLTSIFPSQNFVSPGDDVSNYIDFLYPRETTPLRGLGCSQIPWFGAITFHDEIYEARRNEPKAKRRCTTTTTTPHSPKPIHLFFHAILVIYANKSFPPKEEILWGIFAQGYYDACAFFQDVGLPWDDMPHTSEEANWKLPNGADRHLAMHHVKRSWLVFGSLVFTLMALTIHTYFPFVSLALMCWSLISPYDIPSMPSLPTLLLVPLTMYLFYQEQYVHYDVESFKDFTAYELWRGLWPVIMYCVVRFKFYILLVMVCMVLSDWSPYMLWTRMLSFAFLCGLRLLISLIYFQEAEDFKEKYYKKYF